MSISVAPEPRDPSELYEHEIRAAISSRLAAGASLSELLSTMDGADPPTVVSALRRLDDGPYRASARAVLAQAEIEVCAEPPAPLPVPHPLDYAWHFSSDTADRLLRRLAALTEPGQRIGHLGTPTLHGRAVSELPDRTHVLIDLDQRRIAAAPHTARADAIQLDLLDPGLPDLLFDLCIADPPWYPEHTGCFMNAAAIMLRPGGRLLLSFAGRLTRPRLEVDRAEIIAAAGGDALRLDQFEPSTCRYRTPPFEYQAFAAAGLRCIPEAWRSGDLLTFSREESQPPARRILAHPRWLSIEVEQIPLHVRPDAPTHGSALISSLVDGDVLQTVSRRAPVRSSVALWTSRNRVFASRDPVRLSHIVAALADRDLASLEKLSAHGEAQRVLSEIRRIVRTERVEHQLT